MDIDYCGECGGILKGEFGLNRAFTYRRGFIFDIPADIEIPTCQNCSSRFINSELRESIKVILKPQHDSNQKQHIKYLIDHIQKDSCISISLLEKACGVTPTYLSHILAGKKDASELLIGLLEAYAVFPSEIQRRLKRKNGYDTNSIHEVLFSK